jgi:hypothetical protein
LRACNKTARLENPIGSISTLATSGRRFFDILTKSSVTSLSVVACALAIGHYGTALSDEAPMARKPTLTLDALQTLGPEVLARLVLDEAETNASFKRRVSAALAGQSGPEAIAKLIDRRLSGLDRARGFVDWDRARAFRDDLQSLVATIAKDLGPVAPTLSVDRLLRFIASHEKVFERVDDSSGRVQDVYYTAIAAMGDLTERLSEADAGLLPEKIMDALGETTHGYLIEVANAVVPHLPTPTLAAWDIDLGERIVERHAAETLQRQAGRWFYSMTDQWRDIRQAIAAARGDLDGLIVLETGKAPHAQDTLGIAARLLDAYSGASGHSFRQHQATYSGVSGHL